MTETDATPVLQAALRKISAAIEGLGHKSVAIGDMAHQVWGSQRPVSTVDLLISSSEAQRESLLGAARGEGLVNAPGGAPLSMRYTDRRLGGNVGVELVEASTSFLKQVIARAQRGIALASQMQIATCDDLILIRTASADPTHRASVIELLRWNAGRIDAPYLKKEAEAAGIFDKLKSAWQEAKQQG
jgi:hypothetical protein